MVHLLHLAGVRGEHLARLFLDYFFLVKIPRYYLFYLGPNLVLLCFKHDQFLGLISLHQTIHESIDLLCFYLHGLWKTLWIKSARPCEKTGRKCVVPYRLLLVLRREVNLGEGLEVKILGRCEGQKLLVLARLF